MSSNLLEKEVYGCKVSYTVEDLIGLDSIKKYEIALNLNGKLIKHKMICEEIAFEDELGEFVFIQKLRNKK